MFGGAISTRPDLRGRIAPWLNELNGEAVASLGDALRIAGELRRKHKNNAVFMRFDKIIQEWIADPYRCFALKQDARELVATGSGPDECRLLLGALVHAVPDAPELFRGDGDSESIWVALQQFPLGGTLDLPLASFTSDRTRAEEFAWLRVEEGALTEVVFVLRAGSRAVRIETLAPDEIHWREREWYTGGRFIIEHARVIDDGRLEVTLQQDAVFDVS